MSSKWMLCNIFFIFSAHADALLTEYYPARTKSVLEQALEKNSRQLLCGRIKIKDGALEEVRQWFQTLLKRKEELLEAFASEGVCSSLFFWSIRRRVTFSSII